MPMLSIPLFGAAQTRHSTLCSEPRLRVCKSCLAGGLSLSSQKYKRLDDLLV
ncbi:hypothetical protein I79_006259 [Cricetulus griseus]|uniref:Uncharacterized protein n=1 Tax=Cricetulus griseus TaxID=10029 RepID=G3H7C9_CRIGR|nr:hypothetical protein I79_006259 [Cricetulus griseus]